MLGGDTINLVCSAGFRISVVHKCSTSDGQVHLKCRLFSGSEINLYFLVSRGLQPELNKCYLK